MCGIFGTFYFDRTRTADERTFVAQVDAIAHRGPDDGGAYIAPGIALGHRRLSIIDLDGGHQPMWDVENRLAIVFNGEIYNFKELRRTLRRKGHRFVTDSDTEVILHSYREWGGACVDHFVGMFAFAIFDRKERTLFLARDRMGKKPLYYYKDSERVVFGSELKSFLLDKSMPRVIEPRAVVDYFAYNYVPGPETILQDYYKLPAGCAMVVRESGVKTVKYWDVDFAAQQTLSVGEARDTLEQVLRDSVGLRLRSDVPLGAFLSGGIDSSLIVALMAEASDAPVNTHTIGFSESAHDEREYAKETSEHFSTQHFERMVRVDATSALGALSWFADEPFGDSSLLPTYYLSEATRENVTVALSGDGGDENFAGYRRYVFAMYEEQVRRRVPGPLRRGAFGAAAKVYPKADYLPQKLRAKATLSNLSVSHERAYFLSLTQKSYPKFLAEEFWAGMQAYDPFGHFEKHLQHTEGYDALSKLQYVDLKMYLCDDILVKVDRASMAHGLEVRVPLLDHRVVELAASLPPQMKLDGQRTKILLRELAKKRLPSSVLDRPKKGFTIPLPEWFRGGLKERAEGAFFGGGQSGLLSTHGLRKLWKEHQRGVRNHATTLWSALMFELWAERFLKSDVKPCKFGAAARAKPTRLQPPLV